MSNTNINVHTNITANAPRPLDSKVRVGVGQEYTDKDLIPTTYRYVGMRVLDDNFIEWEYYRYGSNYYWRNISIGVEPFLYKYNNVLLNPWGQTTINNLQVGETIQFDAITFGIVKFLEWKIVRSGVTLLTANKESFSYVLPLTGNYTITLKVVYFNGYEVAINPITLFNVSQIGIINISQFTVNPEIGLQQSTNRTYNFNITLNETVVSSEIVTLDILYKPVGTDNATTINLISSGNAINGISVSGNSIIVSGNSINAFKDVYFPNSMEFTASILKTNGQTSSATTIYTSVPLININEDANVTYINYDYVNNIVSGQVELVTAYSNSTVTGTITKGSTTRNLSVTLSKVFSFSFVEDLQAGAYDYNIQLTQSVNSETYIETITLQLLVEPDSLTIGNYNIVYELGYPDAQHKLLMSAIFSRNPDINNIQTFTASYIVGNSPQTAINLDTTAFNNNIFTQLVERTLTGLGAYTFKINYKENGMPSTVFSNTDSYLVTPKILINSLTVNSFGQVTANVNKTQLSSTYEGRSYVLYETLNGGASVLVSNYSWVNSQITFTSTLVDENTLNGAEYSLYIGEVLGNKANPDNNSSNNTMTITYTTADKVYWGILSEPVMNSVGYSVATEDPAKGYCTTYPGYTSALAIADTAQLRSEILTDSFITNSSNIMSSTGALGYSNSNPSGYFAALYQNYATILGLPQNSRGYSWVAVPTNIRVFQLAGSYNYLPNEDIGLKYLTIPITINGSEYNIYVFKAFFDYQIGEFPMLLNANPIISNVQFD